MADGGRSIGYQLWRDEGWVSAKPDLKPLNPNTDYHEWKALVEEAGLRERRLHDTRHTAATVLAILNVPTTHATTSWMVECRDGSPIQHMLDSIHRGVANQVGWLLWGGPQPTGD
jgi:integrase